MNRVLIGDIIRTRIKEKHIFSDNYEKNLKFLIKLYINKENITYKQGINEIFGSFLFLYKTDLSLIYNISLSFINKFLINYYDNTNSMFYLNLSFKLIKILLNYHDPILYNKLDSCEIPPELYATSWILTYFSSKMTIKELYIFWDLVIKYNDEKLIFYLIVSLLIIFRKDILSKDTSNLLLFLSTIKLEEDEIFAIFYFALFIKGQTPFSFLILVDKLKIFKKNKGNDVEIIMSKGFYRDLDLNIMPFFVSEILAYCFPDRISCYDENCENYIINRSKNSKEKENKHVKDKNKLQLFEKEGKCEICNKYGNNNNYIYNDLFIYNNKTLLEKFNSSIKTITKRLVSNYQIEYINSLNASPIEEVFSSIKKNKLNLILIDIKNNKNFSFAIPYTLNVLFNNFFTYNDLVSKFKSNMIIFHYVIISDETKSFYMYNNLIKIRKIVYEKTSTNTNSNSSYSFLDSSFKSSKENEGKKISKSNSICFIDYKKSNFLINHQLNIKNDKSNDMIIYKTTSFSRFLIRLKSKVIESGESDENTFLDFQNLINKFKEKGFRHISYALNGLKEIHKKCVKYKLPLSAHERQSVIQISSLNKENLNKTKCYYCNIIKSEEEVNQYLKSELSYIKDNILLKEENISSIDSIPLLKKIKNLFVNENEKEIENIKENEYLQNLQRLLNVNRLIDKRIPTYFPLNLKSCFEEYIFECKSFDSDNATVDDIVIYILNDKLSIFLCRKENDYENLILNLNMENILRAEKRFDENLFNLLKESRLYKETLKLKSNKKNSSNSLINDTNSSKRSSVENGRVRTESDLFYRRSEVFDFNQEMCLLYSLKAMINSYIINIFYRKNQKKSFQLELNSENMTKKEIFLKSYSFSLMIKFSLGMESNFFSPFFDSFEKLEKFENVVRKNMMDED